MTKTQAIQKSPHIPIRQENPSGISNAKIKNQIARIQALVPGILKNLMGEKGNRSLTKRIGPLRTHLQKLSSMEELAINLTELEELAQKCEKTIHDCLKDPKDKTKEAIDALSDFVASVDPLGFSVRDPSQLNPPSKTPDFSAPSSSESVEFASAPSPTSGFSKFITSILEIIKKLIEALKKPHNQAIPEHIVVVTQLLNDFNERIHNISVLLPGDLLATEQMIKASNMLCTELAQRFTNIEENLSSEERNVLKNAMKQLQNLHTDFTEQFIKSLAENLSQLDDLSIDDLDAIESGLKTCLADHFIRLSSKEEIQTLLRQIPKIRIDKIKKQNLYHLLTRIYQDPDLALYYLIREKLPSKQNPISPTDIKGKLLNSAFFLRDFEKLHKALHDIDIRMETANVYEIREDLDEELRKLDQSISSLATEIEEINELRDLEEKIRLHEEIVNNTKQPSEEFDNRSFELIALRKTFYKKLEIIKMKSQFSNELQNSHHLLDKLQKSLQEKVQPLKQKKNQVELVKKLLPHDERYFPLYQRLNKNPKQKEALEAEIHRIEQSPSDATGYLLPALRKPGVFRNL